MNAASDASPADHADPAGPASPADPAASRSRRRTRTRGPRRPRPLETTDSAASTQMPHDTATTPAPGPELRDLTAPRDGLVPVIDRIQPLLAWCEAAASDPAEPVAVDAERASSYRYSSRAYLVQLRTEAAGTALIDPDRKSVV